MEQKSFFPYSWHIDEDEEDITSIRVYGLDDKNQNVCIRVDNFTPFVYLELPEHIPWTDSKAQLVCNKLDTLLGKNKPLVKSLIYKKKLYYAYLTKNKKRKTFPYLFLSFSHQSDIRILSYKIRQPINIIGVGPIKFKMHEQDASPILQFISYRNISTAGWIDFLGKRIEKDSQITLCDHEYKVKWKNVKPNTLVTVAAPLIMGFDIEVNSTNPSAMPKSENPGDKIFQISCVLFRHGCEEKSMEKYLLTLGEPNPEKVGEDVEILMYETENDLLIGYTEFLQEKNPNIIVGYNILNFDIPYMIDRAKMNFCIFEFDQQGFTKNSHSKEKTIKWSSSAYGNQTFQFLDAEGRLYVDLLPLVKRDYKMDNYKLKTISTFFLGSTKDPLSVKGIFKCYRIGIKNKDGVYSKHAQKAMGVVGKYCVQDSVLVIKLFNKLQTWIGLCEMAKTSNVPIFYLYTQGQQIKVYSQIYKFCMYNNFVVEKDGYVPKDNEHFVGATVFTPKAGVYDIVLPFDFASLYPTTIIAYNIDYSTLVIDPEIPDSDCHVMDWFDHVGCFPKGTKITLGEYSMNIEDLNKYTGQLLAYDGKNGLDYFNQTNFFDQGMKECIEVTFNDGTTLKCTPDHRLLVGDGKWIEAQDVKINKDKVNVGYSPPVYDVSDDVLIIDEYVLRGRELIIFYKLLGLLCTDGDCRKGTSIIYSGHQIDIQNITRDIEFITKDKQSFSIYKENYGWGIRIKGRFGEILRDLDGMMWGNKSTQTRTLPSILKNASDGELCAFLSGIMGGDGHTSSFSEKAQSIESIKLSWTSEHENMLDPIFNKLHEYFTKCGVQTSVYRIKNKTFLSIKVEDTIKFQEKIGFSYCVHKSMRLEAGCSYLRYREKTWEQQKYMTERVRELKTKISTEDAINIVIEEINNDFPVYNTYYTNPTKSQMIDRKKLYKPIGPMEYMKEINALNIFDSYGINKDENSIQCIQKTIIYKRSIGIHQTYDLEVETSHSFVADGIVVHNCEHDKTIRKTKPKHVMCEKRHFRFLKEPKGVMPTVLQNLLDARANTRKQIKVIKKIVEYKDIEENEFKLVIELIPAVIKLIENKEKITDKIIKELTILVNVLDKRQLAYKVSANSMYGAMGVTRGYLPFMPGAMCTTAMGRKNIGIVAETIPKKYGGQLIYGDTDSSYIVFPKLKTAHENWDHALFVAEEVTKMFPAPICLEFEMEIYWRFFILTKKRYMYKKCFRDGVVDQNIGKKGVLLARRDNSIFVRNSYETLIMMVFNRSTRNEIINYVLEIINKLCSHFYSYKDFVVTKSIGNHGDGQVIPVINEKGQKKGKMGDYIVPLLSNEPKERQRQFKLKNCNNKKDSVNAKEYYIHCLPAVVQLAERMRSRGQRVDSGTRLEYVISDLGGHKAKQYVKVEDAIYFGQHSSVLRLDYMYYLKLMANPFDDVLNILYDKEDDSNYKFQKNLVLNQYKYRLRTRTKMLNELNNILGPVLILK
jgi:DNA polymerase elongation subunit (family B)